MRLFLAAFLALFTVMTLGRFVLGHVSAAAAYPNLLASGSLLGLGGGFLLSGKVERAERLTLPLLLPLLLAVRLLPGETGHGGVFVQSAMALALHLLTAVALVPVACLAGRLFENLRPAHGWSLSLGGALTGVALFSVMAQLRLPPLAWFAVIAVAGLGITLRHSWEFAAGIVIGTGVLLLVWSTDNPGHRSDTPYGLDSADELVGSYTERARLPYLLAHSLDDVLILGAGGGNDVAMAVHMGAKSVDVVETAPALPDIGWARHRQLPWNSRAVSLHVAEPRAYLENCRKEYDLVLFRPPQVVSHILRGNDLFTRESFEQARSLLKPMGVLAVPHGPQPDYILDRIFLMLTHAAKRPPLHVSFADGGIIDGMFMQGEPVPLRDPTREHAKRLRKQTTPTDNWPFLCRKSPGIPWRHGLVLVGMLAVALLMAGSAFRHRKRFNLPLFVLGTATFLLAAWSARQVTLIGLPAAGRWLTVMLSAALPLCLVAITSRDAFRQAAASRDALGAALLGAAAGGTLGHLGAWLGTNSIALLAAFLLLVVLTFNRRAGCRRQ